MATQQDVRRIALSLPETTEAADHFAFSVLNRGRRRGFVWVWAERVHPKRPRVPNPAVVAVRVADGLEKELILRSDQDKFLHGAALRRLPGRADQARRGRRAGARGAGHERLAVPGVAGAPGGLRPRLTARAGPVSRPAWAGQVPGRSGRPLPPPVMRC